MSDAARRDLERRAQTDGPEAQAALVAARWRAGELTPDALELLAYLELPGALELVPPAERSWRAELAELAVLSLPPAQGRFRLERWPDACLLAAWLATGAAVAAAQDLEPRDRERLRSLWRRARPRAGLEADAALAELAVEVYERAPGHAGPHAARAVHLLISTGGYHGAPSIALSAFESAAAAAGEEEVGAAVAAGLVRWVLGLDPLDG